jgi:uncharacterized protein involved in exopolysaccharide biosynthesis
MNPTQRPDSFESADYVGVLRRRWLIVLILTLVGVAGAFAYVTVAPKSYTATAAVDVTPTGAEPGNAVAGSRTANAQVNLDTEAQVMTSTPVATLAAKIMHSPLTPWALAQQIKVTVPPNSSLLNVACTEATATGAANCANDFVKAYLQNRSASATATLNGQIANLTSKLNLLKTQETSLTAKIAKLSRGSAAKLSDEVTLSSIRGQAQQYTNELAQLNINESKDAGGSVSTVASPPGKPSSPKKSLILPSGLVAGLLLGLIVAFIVDRRDKRIRGPQDVQRQLDLEVLLNLPKGAFGREVSIASPRSRTGQAFTDLGHAVAAALGEGNHIVFVASARPGRAGSVVAANLAVTLARTHSDVVLVCADLEGTIAPKMLGLGTGEGLAELVSGSATVQDVVRGPAGMPGLWVITPGADPSLGLYNLQHDTARALVTQLRRDARYVVIEAPAGGDAADTFALGEFADAALITIEIGNTDQANAADCVRRLRQLRTPILGAAVLPALGRIAVRPPRQPQPRGGPGELGRDGLPAGSGEISAMSGTSAGADRRDRLARSRDGHGGRPDNSGS